MAAVKSTGNRSTELVLRARLVRSGRSPDQIAEELYLAALCRLPSENEIAASLPLVEASESPAEGYEDLLWALMNSKQFLFVY